MKSFGGRTGPRNMRVRWNIIEWSDFAFGEPSITVVPDGTLLVTLWCIQPSGQGIRYVKLKLE